MNSNRPRDKRRFLAPSAAISAFVFLVLMMMIIIVMVKPDMTYGQLALFPFLSTNQEVLPTYISRIIPGAAFEASLFHYYPEDIAIPAGTTIMIPVDHTLLRVVLLMVLRIFLTPA
jgi:hypothetical protein